MGSCYAELSVSYAIDQIGKTCGKTNIYSEELDSIDYFNTKKNGYADSCSIFVHACIYHGTVDPELDKWTALYMMYCPQDGTNAAAGCTQAAGYFKANNAFYTKSKDFERGDQVFFKKSNGAIYHTGILVEWNEKGFYTVEGNTNGGMVAKKFYSYDDSKIAGVGRPRYDGWSYPVKDNNPVSDSEALYKKLAHDCIEGYYGNGLDRKHKINSLGYGNIYPIVQKYVNMILQGLMS